MESISEDPTMSTAWIRKYKADFMSKKFFAAAFFQANTLNSLKEIEEPAEEISPEPIPLICLENDELIVEIGDFGFEDPGLISANSKHLYHK